MPSSHPNQINQIVRLMMLLNPQSVLDIGVGFGKYGFLAREYLELWDGREDYKNWRRTIDGIEAFADYLTPIHKFVYNNIFIGDALLVTQTLDKHYDLILLIDVLEHFSYKDGTRLIARCKSIGDHIFISTPAGRSKQGSSFNNIYETHRHRWKKRQLECLDGTITTLQQGSSWMCYIGKRVEAMREAFK